MGATGKTPGSLWEHRHKQLRNTLTFANPMPLIKITSVNIQIVSVLSAPKGYKDGFGPHSFIYVVLTSPVVILFLQNLWLFAQLNSVTTGSRCCFDLGTSLSVRNQAVPWIKHEIPLLLISRKLVEDLFLVEKRKESIFSFCES